VVEYKVWYGSHGGEGYVEVCFGEVWCGRKFAEDRTGVIWYGMVGTGLAVAARMFWVGLDVVRQEFAKARWGSDACGMFRQSRSLTDRTGAVWWGVLWFGSRGWVCLGAMRRGTLRFGSRGLDGMGAVR
jgi:hypothetical protein